MRSSILFVSISVAACTSNHGATSAGPATMTHLSASSATSSVANIRQVRQAMASNDPALALGGVLGFVTIGEESAAGAPARVVVQLAPGWEKTAAASFTGSASCDANSCTFSGFGESTPGLSIQLDGTIARNGDTFSFDVKMTIVTDTVSLDWQIDGALTITDTTLDGHVHAGGTATASSSTVAWDVTATYSAIQIVNDCAVGGSLAYDVSAVESGASSRSVHVVGSATFGPACGEVQ